MNGRKKRAYSDVKEIRESKAIYAFANFQISSLHLRILTLSLQIYAIKYTLNLEYIFLNGFTVY